MYVKVPENTQLKVQLYFLNIKHIKNTFMFLFKYSDIQTSENE